MKNLSISTKFLIPIAIFIAACLAITFINLLTMTKIESMEHTILRSNLPKAELSASLFTLAIEIRNYEKVHILEPTAAGKTRIGDKIDGIQKKMKDGMAQLGELLILPESQEALRQAEKLLEEWQIVDQQIRKLSAAGQDKEAVSLARGQSRELLEKFDVLMEQIAQGNKKLLTDSLAQLEVAQNQARLTTILLSAFAIICGMLLTWFMLRQINRGIDQVITGLEQCSREVSSASRSMAASSEKLSQSSSEQAAALQETSAAFDEISSMVQANSESAKQSSSASHSSAQSVLRGQNILNDMKQAILEISNFNGRFASQAEASSEKISGIAEIINQIDSKTKIINDIVFQTKLLSFNASVEAARAGEHGKGFAVVAQEVGTLAEMSGNAAKEIRSMLDKSIHRVESIVLENRGDVRKLLEESRQRVEIATQVASECGKLFDEIVASIGLAEKMSQSISTASEEQARGILEVSNAVTQLDQTTQLNAAMSEQAASASEQLSAQAQKLQQHVETLLTTIKGGQMLDQGQSLSAGSATVIPIRMRSRKSHSELRRVVGSDTYDPEDFSEFEDESEIDRQRES